MATLDEIQELDPNARLMGERYLLMNCPWHDDSQASLAVFPDGWAVCWGECDKARHIDDLMAELQGYDARPTVRKAKPPYLPNDIYDLEDLVNQAHARIKRNNSYQIYPEARGIEDMIDTCRLGWYNGWMTIPVYRQTEELHGLILRAGPQAQAETGLRFTQPHGQRAMLYCPDWNLLSNAEEILIPYGMVDAIALAKLGALAFTTTGGARSFVPAWLDSYRLRCKIIPDQGEDHYAFALASHLGWRGEVVSLAFPPGIKDPAAYLENGLEDSLSQQLGLGKKGSE